MSRHAPDTPQLLAPAGGPDALRAAVAAGADAVYLGVEELNARRGAENFTRETLKDACEFAHLYDVGVYLTANVLVLPSEMETALTLVDEAWAAGADAVIVQDLGLLRVVRSQLPQVRLHASTQINAHSSDTIRALAAMGVSRITLARETSIDEIRVLASVAAEEGVEIESFAHGALCVCYSGQCLLSSLIGGRSANRGLCAQPCRLPYELVDEGGAVLADVGAHLLSPKDLASITVLPGLVEAGVTAVKLEGRMKSAEYVAVVTGVYRVALDRAVQMAEAFEVRDGEMAVLSEAFSRGFTEAYLTGERGNAMMSYRRPNNRGVPIGRIASVSAGAGRSWEADLTLEASADAEDTIEVWTSRGRFAQAVGPLGYAGSKHASAPAGMSVRVRLEEPAQPGDRVFRVRNAALSSAAARSFADRTGPGIGLRMTVSLVEGEPAAVSVADPQGRSGVASGGKVEPARTRSVSAEEVAEHVGRLGGTRYRAASWDISLSPGVGIGFSELHRLRREAIAAYERGRLAEWARRERAMPLLPEVIRLSPPRETRGAVRLVASVSSMDAAYACLEAGADAVHVPSWAIPKGESLPDGVVPAIPRVCHDDEAADLYAPAMRADRCVAGTLGALRALAENNLSVEAHWSLNALNPYAPAHLADLGASLVWLSPELNAKQLAITAQGSPVPTGVAVSGRQELMVTEHCVLMAEGACGERCEACGRREGRRFLVDRKGYRFPVVTDATGRTHVYNAVPLDLTPVISDVITTGVQAVRVDAETESVSDAAEAVARARVALGRASRGQTLSKPPSPVTSGHFFRGVS